MRTILSLLAAYRGRTEGMVVLLHSNECYFKFIGGFRIETSSSKTAVQLNQANALIAAVTTSVLICYSILFYFRLHNVLRHRRGSRTDELKQTRWRD